MSFFENEQNKSPFYLRNPKEPQGAPRSPPRIPKRPKGPQKIPRNPKEPQGNQRDPKGTQKNPKESFPKEDLSGGPVSPDPKSLF